MFMLVFMPYPWKSFEKKDWVEVSVTTFPDFTQQIPEDMEGLPEEPEPTLAEPEQHRPDISAEAAEHEIGVTVETLSPRMPELVRIDEERPIRREKPKVTPGRRERSGLSEGPGEDETMVIAGPVSRRKVLNRVYPEYPSWAEEKGIEGEVHLKFWVTPDGIVESVETEKTSGYPDFDSRALRALNQYRFSALSSQEEQKTQWGTIVIKYTLR